MILLYNFLANSGSIVIERQNELIPSRPSYLMKSNNTLNIDVIKLSTISIQFWWFKWIIKVTVNTFQIYRVTKFHSFCYIYAKNYVTITNLTFHFNLLCFLWHFVVCKSVPMDSSSFSSLFTSNHFMYYQYNRSQLLVI